MKQISFFCLWTIVELVFTMALMPTLLQAQHACGTRISTEALAELDAHPVPIMGVALRSMQGTIEVPIKIHILQCSTSGQNGVSDADINAGLAVLNTKFSDVPMHFYECGARNYIDNCSFYNFEDTEESTLADNHDAHKVINIYFTSSINSGSVGGYTYLPMENNQVHRIFIANEWAAQGLVLTHEMGHFLGLLHTHGPGVAGSTTELVSDLTGSGTLLTGDRVRDTPADPAKELNVVTSATACMYPVSTALSPLSCPNFCDANGDIYQPLGNNVMFYRVCSLGSFNSLTQQQLDRILTFYNDFKTHLKGVDLVIHDASDDIGREPNLQTVDIWYSPDVWNCVGADNCEVPQNPEYQLSATNYNYMRVRVTNRGCNTSPNNVARMYMHWTLGRTGEIWNADWIATPTNVIDGQTAGSEILSSPLSNGLIPTLAPGESVIKTFKWQPPNPSLFTSLPEISDGNIDSWPMLCLLAYVKDLPSDPLVNTATNIEVAHRVRDNNNCATRNMYLLDLIPGTPPLSPIGSIYVQHIGTQNAYLNIHIEDISIGQARTFEQQGKLTLILDEGLWQLWSDAHFAGTGVRIVEDYVVEVTDLTNATLSGLLFRPNEYHKMGLRFVLDEETTPEARPYRFNVRHSVNSETNRYEYGGGVFEVNVRAAAAKQQATTTPSTPLLQISPNPLSSKANAQIDLAAPDILSLYLSDLNGRVCRQVLTNVPVSAGKHQIELDLSGLPKGVYVCYLQTKEQTISQKITVTY